MLKPYLPSFIKYNWIFGLVLILVITVIRFYVILEANISNSFLDAAILFTGMMVLPFIFLNKEGRKFIGITKPKNHWWLLISFIAGFAVCSIIYLIFTALYDHSINNGFVYMNKFDPSTIMNPSDKLTLFIFASISCMTFSPLGEELFYRGIIHGSFVSQFGENRASIFDSLAFAIAHLSHFGIVYILGEWKILPLPALIWFVGMFFLSQVFFLCKQKTGSIVGAIIAHAGFNFAMMYYTFYHIL